MFNLIIHERGSEKKYPATSFEVEKPRLKFIRENVTEYIPLRGYSFEKPDISVIIDDLKTYPQYDLHNYEKVIEERRKIKTVESTLSFEVMQTETRTTTWATLLCGKYVATYSIVNKVVMLVDRNTNNLVEEISCNFSEGESIYLTSSSTVAYSDFILLNGFLSSYKINLKTKNVQIMPSLVNNTKDKMLANSRLLPCEKMLMIQSNFNSIVDNTESPLILDIKKWEKSDVLKFEPFTGLYPSRYKHKTSEKPCLGYDYKLFGFTLQSSDAIYNHLLTFDLKTGKNYESLSHFSDQIGKMFTYLDGTIYSFPPTGKSTTLHGVYKKDGDNFTQIANLAPSGGLNPSNINYFIVLAKDGWFYTTSLSHTYVTRWNPLTNVVQHFDMSLYGDENGVFSRGLIFTENQDLIFLRYGKAPVKIKINGAEKNIVLESPYFTY